ncbi:MAG: exopolysaccharide biosynthesis polyprenyl glycosylphosphotransferase [Verrucomicrobiaceae bacterium]|nr:exopolysaccharide biosynthesis polyprenyl glycosylphosphotransferase [Verrucomicrobiaceae bacterium]
MSIYGNRSRHWESVGRRFMTDALLVALSFYASSVIRFSEWWPEKLGFYLPPIVVCSFLLPCVIYIFGLYSEESMHFSGFRRSVLLSAALGLTLVVALAYGSIDLDARIGRGVMGLAAMFFSLSVSMHHVVLLNRARRRPLRLACLVITADDLEEAHRLASIDKPQVKFAGIVTGADYAPADSRGLAELGRFDDFDAGRAGDQFDGIVVRQTHVLRAEIASPLRSLRYQGLHIMTLIDAFEDLFQMVPVELIDGGWLLQACSMPQMIYIRKLKRAFDIVVSLVLLLLLGPICLAAMLLIRLTSRGPVLFRQTRSGRFGKVFTVVKLRTMRTDAEADGPRWSSAGDARVTPLGRLLRKYRIDEIPQLINILRGEMSFVGPRPERPEFVSDLEKQIPHYRERLHLQPGLTGWAQVCYPYGATVEDARRKLEYDLYYLKHMSLALDVFTLLDTVRIILNGGARSAPRVPAFVNGNDKHREVAVPLPSTVSGSSPS